MPLNPIQTGKQVVDQFGRYLQTTFPIAQPALESQFREYLHHGLGGEQLLAKGPYVSLSRPFEQGPGIETLIAESDLGLHPVLKGLFPYDTLHKHQELAIRSIVADRHTVLSTGTGSGKTEAFLLPIVNHCLQLRDQKTEAGVVAILIYPMNALVNDQLKRIRTMLAGTGIRFARYTGETPWDPSDTLQQMEYSRAYTADELQRLDEDEDFDLIPWEECYSRADILDPEKRPRIILTNYQQLEYLLLRDRDLDLFRAAPLRYLVLDEIHTYTGELGSEVACLIRRLRSVVEKQADELICIGTSATISNNKGHVDPVSLTKEFGNRLFGVEQETIEVIGEVYKKLEPPSEDSYVPSFPKDAIELLGRLLEAARPTQIRDEVRDIPANLLAIAEELCGRNAPARPTTLERLYTLLSDNRLVYQLGQIFTESVLIEEVLPRVKSIGDRERQDHDAIVSEVLAYLTLGTLAQKDGEPLLRPKLHYFLRGLHGLWITHEPEGMRLFMAREEAQANSAYLPVPLMLCKSCGQHYFRVFVENEGVLSDGGHGGYYKIRIPLEKADDTSLHEREVYLTDELVTAFDETLTEEYLYYCRYCGTLHNTEPSSCLNDKCQRKGPDAFLRVLTFPLEEIGKCPSCGSPRSHLVFTHSIEVYDVHTLAQSMLSAMPERALQKLIIFVDSRQDAAFQAGWMDERSKRFRLRHILYSVLHDDPAKVWTINRLAEEILERALEAGLYKRMPWGQEDDETRVKWFLLEEFGSVQQRRLGLENLGLVKRLYHGLGVESDPDFFKHWGKILGLSAEDVAVVVRLILDYYRRHGTIADPLFQRAWGYQDKEYRKGIVQTAEHWYPQILIKESLPKDHRNKRFTYGLIASNGRSAAQLIITSAVPDKVREAADYGPNRDQFLSKVWDWLHKEGILVRAELKRRIRGRIEQISFPAPVFQIDIDHIGIIETEERYLCNACRRAHAETLPTNKCTEYLCKGLLSQTGRDLDNYDVFQYTQLAFVPMRPWEHSAGVPSYKRQEVETEFKKRNGKYNCIVCTPTLELGVNIGQLDMILMRNVPPATTNYAQRSGRAGRQHRIATIFTYCRDMSHDQYFYVRPEDMIAGAVKVPAFSMKNEPLIRKHLHSTILTRLREIIATGGKDVLNEAFPTYLWSYLGEKVPDQRDEEVIRLRYYDTPPQFDALTSLIEKYHDQLEANLAETFINYWPEEEKESLSVELIREVISQFTPRLNDEVSKLHTRIRKYRERVKELNRQAETSTLTPDEEKELKAHKKAVDRYNMQNRDNYSLGYLARVGFFPGYALTREGVLAQCIDPFEEIRRPVAIAIRELTPSNFVYANKNVFRIQKVNFRQPGEDPQTSLGESYFRPMVYDVGLDRVIDSATREVEGGDSPKESIEICPLREIELVNIETIDDRRTARRQVGFNIYGLCLEDHHGGHEGKIGPKQYRYLVNQRVQLINIGPTRLLRKGVSNSLFPICPHCGTVRDPFMSEAEIEKFIERHQQTCSIREIKKSGLFVELRSDTFQIGPFDDHRHAVNVLESIPIGARDVLDMGEAEIEGFVSTDDNGHHWLVYYDPVPGGSGYIPQVMKYWETIIENGRQIVTNCPRQCADACYSCLLHFRNQRYHPELNRYTAEQCLTDLLGSLIKTNDIAPKYLHVRVEPGESESEDIFIEVITRHSFPLPDASQYSVDLNDGSFTVPDYAYSEHKVLIYVDGMSKRLHGDPAQQKQDTRIRAKLRMMGYFVMEITSVSLRDDTVVRHFLDELAQYLGHNS